MTDKIYYHDDFITCLEKISKYEDKQKRIEPATHKGCSVLPNRSVCDFGCGFIKTKESSDVTT